MQAVTVSADYATAGLHATIVTDDYFSRGRARAELHDVVTFDVAGADASTVTTIGLDFTLDGNVSSLTNLNYQYDFKMFANGRAGLSAGFATYLFEDPADPCNYVGWAGSGGVGAPDGFITWELLANSVTEKHLHGTFTITGAQTAFDFIMGLSLECTGGTDCYFGNSGHMSFDLPDNVSLSNGLWLAAHRQRGAGAGAGDLCADACRPRHDRLAAPSAARGLSFHVHSTVTLLARFRGLSTSVPRATAV